MTTLKRVGLAASFAISVGAAGAASPGPMKLRCEYLVDPQGIDVTAPRLSWMVESERRGYKQSVYRILVASGPEKLQGDVGDLWDSGKVTADQSTQVVYAGRPLQSRMVCFWKVKTWDEDEAESSWSEPAQWSMGLLQSKDWVAKWISMKPKQPAGEPLDSHDSPMLRKVFNITKPVERAQVSICGLGYYELFLNESKVGDHVLDPAWTPYHKRALYVTYDLSEALKQGKNAFGVQLANGVYNQEFRDAWRFHEAPWRAFPQMLLQLDVVYEDGTRQQVISDSSWKTSTGPIYWDQLRMGVMYDARREQPGWSTAAFDDSAWQPAIVREGLAGRLDAQMSEPIKVMRTLQPVSIEKQEGYCLVDFGQNIAGWTRLKISGKAGTRITLDHGSHAHVKGKPLQTCVYTLKGEGAEVWEPGFTYHGFCKVKVSGFPGEPSRTNFDARVVHTAFEERGGFECSNPLLNKIVEATRWSYIGNFVGIPTDCPHREKNGWTGDAHVASELGLLYYGSEAAYTRWMADFKAIQREDGKLPAIVPTGGWGFGRLDGPAWEIAYIMIPWHLYELRGDRRLLKTHYDSYKRWLDWYRHHPSVNKGHIIEYGLGDWVPIKTRTPSSLTSTGYYFAAAKRLAMVAGMLGKRAEQKEYSELAETIKKAFNERFYDQEKGIYEPGSQTAMSCALFRGLVEPGNRQWVVQNLVDSIQQQDCALDCGFLGSKYLLRALSENGHTDVAYAMVVKDDTPGWGKMIRSGNTTLWETFKCGGSDNHVFLGDVTAWMMEYLAGIRHDVNHPGFQRFVISPEIPEGLEWVKAHHDSPFGRIQSAWKKAGDMLTLDVSVPANCVAAVSVPTEAPGEVSESGKPAAEAEGVTFFRKEEGRVVYLTGSGHYRFSSRWRK